MVKGPTPSKRFGPFHEKTWRGHRIDLMKPTSPSKGDRDFLAPALVGLLKVTPGANCLSGGYSS